VKGLFDELGDEISARITWARPAPAAGPQPRRNDKRAKNGATRELEGAGAVRP
jgi:hypothetical protein